GPTTVSLSADAPAGSVLELTVDSADDLAVDDRAFAAVSARERASVCLVTAGNPPLERALRADPSARVRVVAPADYRGPEGASVVIVDGPGLPPRPIGGGGTGAAADGYLFIGTPDPFGWSTAREWVDAPPVTHWA